MSRFGLLNPANMQVSTGGGFRGGLVRVDKSRFVVQAQTINGATETKLNLVWHCTYVDETMEPLVDPATEENQVEELRFGLGGKALAAFHPGSAASPSTPDSDVDDLGVEDGTEGVTLYTVPAKDSNSPFQVHESTGIAVLIRSLIKCGLSPEIADSTWAPAFEGMVVNIISQPMLNDNKQPKLSDKGRPITQKAVDKIARMPQAKAAKGAAKPTAEDVDEILGGLIAAVLEGISMPVTRKVFDQRVAQAATKAKVPVKLLVPLRTKLNDTDLIGALIAAAGGELDGETVKQAE